MPEPHTSDAAIRDRAVGALVGLAVGDAVGTALEFTPRDSTPPLTDMVGGGPFNLAPGEWTDDTAMALALADSLLTCGELDEADLMRRFVRWWRQGAYTHNGRCFDIGITVAAALARFERTGDPIAGSTHPRSAGNGSLMRLAPVAIRYWNDPSRVRDAATRQSRTTHAAPEAVDACVAYASMLAAALAGQPLNEAVNSAAGEYAPAIQAVVDGSWRQKTRDAVRGSGYVVHSLEAALWCVANAGGSYRDAVLLAANLGEDADTTAAIAGQLAGALGGLSSIPIEWRSRLAWGEQIRSTASALADQSLIRA